VKRAAVVVLLLTGCRTFGADFVWTSRHVGRPGLSDTVPLQCPATPAAAARPGTPRSIRLAAIEDLRPHGDTLMRSPLQNYRADSSIGLGLNLRSRVVVDTVWYDEEVPVLWREPLTDLTAERVSRLLAARGVARDTAAVAPAGAVILRVVLRDVFAEAHRRTRGASRIEVTARVTLLATLERATLELWRDSIRVADTAATSAVSPRVAIALTARAYCRATALLAAVVDSVSREFMTSSSHLHAGGASVGP